MRRTRQKLRLRRGPPAHLPAWAAGLMVFLLAAHSGSGAAEPQGELPGARLEGSAKPDRSERRRPRRLREYASNPDAEWVIELVQPEPGGRPVPKIDSVSRAWLGDRLALEITASNAGPEPAGDGGITVSIPELDSPGDGRRIVHHEVPEGMALKTFSRGDAMVDRRGRRMVAEYLMIEVHGPWAPFEQKTFRVELEPGQPATWQLQYRSAMADAGGRYLNAPAESAETDQQGWEVVTEIVDLQQLDSPLPLADAAH